MNVLVILLGCHISYLLNDRINTAINFISKFNETNVDWFLSGGIKNSLQDSISEAERMANQLSQFEKVYALSRDNKWGYIYDTKSTNTVENFIMARDYIDSVNIEKSYKNIYVVTSAFHYKRAKQITNRLLNFEPKWVLGNAYLQDSYYWENIFIHNVEDDIKTALKKSKKKLVFV